MRTIEEIKDYLMLQKIEIKDIDVLIKDAIKIEIDYEDNIKNQNYGYALSSDFINSPFILEDEDDVKELEKIEQIGDLIVYKPIYREDEDDEVL